MVKRVADYVRYLQAKEPRTDPEDLHTDTSTSCTSDWVQNSAASLATSERAEWGEQETQLLHRLFVEPQQRLSKGEVTSLFQNKPDLKAIVANKTFEQCFNKIKNMRRKAKH